MEPIWATIVIGVVVGLVVWGISFAIQRNREKKTRREGQYAVVWKKSSNLQPEEVMGSLRGKAKYGFHEYYKPRQHDEEIRKRIEDGKNVLVTGDPLAGKSRAVLQALRSLNDRHDVLIPYPTDIDVENFEIPKRLMETGNPVLLLDDLENYAKLNNCKHLLNRFERCDIQDRGIIVATCRSGPELATARAKLDSYFSLFGDPIEIEKAPAEFANEVADSTGKTVPEHFNGTVGSIFLPLDTMRKRYDECDENQKAVLQSLRRLYLAGIYEGKEEFSVDRVKRVFESLNELTLKPHEWKALLGRLEHRAFLREAGETITVEQTYLEQIVMDEVQLMDNFRSMLGLFGDDPVAMWWLGNAALKAGQSCTDTVEYDEMAVEAYDWALLTWSPEQDALGFANAAHNKGVALQGLTECQGNPSHVQSAVEVLGNASSVYGRLKRPSDLATCQISLGNAFVTLARFHERGQNTRKAIAAYRGALEIYTFEDYPRDFALAQTNVACAYGELANVEDTARNCRRAIAACGEAARVYSADEYPDIYAINKNNLGGLHWTLASVENKEENCKTAIAECKSALEIDRRHVSSLGRALAWYNMGNAYLTLAETQDKVQNTLRSISSFDRALETYTLDRYPWHYAASQQNRGHAFLFLAGSQSSPANLKEAISACKEALKGYDPEAYPDGFAATLSNQGDAHFRLSSHEDQAFNLAAAIVSYDRALEIAKKHDLGARQLSVEGKRRTLAAHATKKLEGKYRNRGPRS